MQISLPRKKVRARRQKQRALQLREAGEPVAHAPDRLRLIAHELADRAESTDAPAVPIIVQRQRQEGIDFGHIRLRMHA